MRLSANWTCLLRVVKATHSTRNCSTRCKWQHTLSRLVSEWSSQSVSQSVSHSVSESVIQSVSKWVSRSVGQSVCHSVSQSVSWTVSLSVSQSVGRSVGQSVGQSVKPINQSAQPLTNLLPGSNTSEAHFLVFLPLMTFFSSACWICSTTASNLHSLKRMAPDLWALSPSWWRDCWTTGPWYSGMTTLTIEWVVLWMCWWVDLCTTECFTKNPPVGNLQWLIVLYQ